MNTNNSNIDTNHQPHSDSLVVDGQVPVDIAPDYLPINQRLAKSKRYGKAIIALVGLSAGSYQFFSSTSVGKDVVHTINSTVSDIAINKNVAEFLDNEQVSEANKKILRDSTLRFETRQEDKPYVCTGTIINGLLFTAGHCINDETEMTIRSWQKDTQPNITVKFGATNYNREQDTGKDLFIGKVEHLSDIPDVKISKFNEKEPEIGETFAMASLPKDTSEPVISNFVYIGQHNGRWLLALIPEEGVPLEKSCYPGASGALVISENAHFGILSRVSTFGEFTEIGTMTIEEFNKQLANFELFTRIKLVGSTDAICFVEPLTQAVVDSYAKTLAEAEVAIGK